MTDHRPDPARSAASELGPLNWSGPLDSPRFDLIRTEDFLPAFDGAMAAHEAEIAAMLREVGAASLDDLAAKAVPAAIRGAPDAMDLPPAADEAAVEQRLRRGVPGC